jgi:hypothetical protein
MVYKKNQNSKKDQYVPTKLWPQLLLIAFACYSIFYVKDGFVKNKISWIFFIAGWIILAILLLYELNAGNEIKRKVLLKNNKRNGVFVDYLPMERKKFVLYLASAIVLIFLGVGFNRYFDF